MRHPPPSRRHNITQAVEWHGIAFTVTPGFDPQTGALCEVFADTRKGGDMAATLADACVLISIALQHGITANQLSKSLARSPDTFAGGDATLPASPIGAIMDAIAGAQS